MQMCLNVIKCIVLFNRYQGKLECAENIATDCPKGSPAGRLLEAYQLAEMMVFAGDVCAAHPSVCSVKTAMVCVSDLGQAVSRYDYLSIDNAAVCK